MFEQVFEQSASVGDDLDPHPPPGRRQAPARRGTEQQVRRYDDPVEVSTGAQQDPDRFLWRGRHWQVREVVAHWVETGAWWARPPSGDLLGECEVWRVTADPGHHGSSFGVFDLVFSWADGSWRLARAVD